MAGLVSVRCLMVWRSSSRPRFAAEAPPARPSEDGMALRIGAGFAARAGLTALGAGAAFGRPLRAATLGAVALRDGPLGAVALGEGALRAAFFAGFLPL